MLALLTATLLCAAPDAGVPAPSDNLVALARAWEAVRLFHPWLYERELDWDQAWVKAAPKAEAARTPDELAAAVGELLATLKDPLTSVRPARVPGEPRDGPAIELKGEVPVLYAATKEFAQIGRNPEVRRKAERALTGHPRVVIDLRGTADQWVSFAFFPGELGPSKDARPPPVRSVVHHGARGADLSRLYDDPPPPHFKVLDGNLGYVELTALEPDEVEPMLKALAGTRAIIFDNRGYPKGTGFTIGPRLDVKHPKGVAQFYEPLVTAGTADEGATSKYFLQKLGKPTGPLYTNPTVMLIDDQAISHAEHTGLIFEAYSGTTFIGSPTAGANGDVSLAPLPGGLRLMYTGHDVRHADGRQLQRIGLVPEVLARPTLAGLRAGRDEVLDAAVAYLKKKVH